jgi:hypothetical protein
LSRIRIIALLATVAMLATAFAACGGGGDSSSENPQTVIDNATLEGVTSGTLDLKLGIKSEGKEGGDLTVSLSGPFQGGAKGSLPQFAMSAKANGSLKGEPVDFEGGLILLSDRGFVNYKGTEYEIDPTSFGIVKSSFEQAQQQGGEETGSGEVTACQEAATGLEVGDFVDSLNNEGSAEVEGTDTTKVSGDLNVGGAIDAIIRLTENPACSAQLEAAGSLPLGELESAKGELTQAVKKAHVDVYVGDDNIIRKIAAELTIEPKGSSNEKVEVEFELSLGAINEEQEIKAPANAQPLEGLFEELGVNPLELLEGTANGGGLGGLLEGLTEGNSLGGSPSGPGSSGPGSDVFECFENAHTPADIQKCANLS